MTIDPNDPRLTAFVLGELDPTESAAIEAMLVESPEGRQAVEEIRLTAQWLGEQLHKESRSPRRPPESIISSSRQAAVPALPGQSWWKRNRSSIIGLAALLMLGATICFMTVVPKSPERVVGLGERNLVVRSTRPAAGASSIQLVERDRPKVDAWPAHFGAR